MPVVIEVSDVGSLQLGKSCGFDIVPSACVKLV